MIPVLVLNTKPQLEKLVSEDLMTAGAVLCEKLDWDLDELTRDPASSWNVTLHSYITGQLDQSVRLT